MATEKKHATGRVKAGDLTKRVGVAQMEARGVNVEELLNKLVAAAGAEFTTYYYYPGCLSGCRRPARKSSV